MSAEAGRGAWAAGAARGAWVACAVRAAWVARAGARGAARAEHWLLTSGPRRLGANVRSGGAIAIALAAAAIAVVLLTRPSHRSSHSPANRTTAPPTTPAPPSPTSAAEAFGANVNRLFNDRTYTAAQISAQLQALRATGATLARSDALWEASEPTPPVNGRHHYDWGFEDQIAGALAVHGLRWLPILDYSAPWAQSIPGQDHSPPRNPNDFAAYASAFAARYGAGGAFWSTHPSLTPQPISTYEIWNEPDNREFWLPTPDAAQYADLYLRARAAIAAVDPKAHVIVGGLSHPEAFLPEMLRARPGLRGHLDGVAIHPYGGNPAVVLARVRTARRVLTSLGLDTVPLYVTELGWTTDPPGSLSFVPQRLRPAFIQTAFSELGHTNCVLAAVLLYTWVTPERNPQDHEDWFGISPPGGGTSADVAAFAVAVLKATAHAPPINLCG